MIFKIQYIAYHNKIQKLNNILSLTYIYISFIFTIEKYDTKLDHKLINKSINKNRLLYPPLRYINIQF